MVLLAGSLLSSSRQSHLLFCHGYTGSRLPLAQTLATPFLWRTAFVGLKHQVVHLHRLGSLVFLLLSSPIVKSISVLSLSSFSAAFSSCVSHILPFHSPLCVFCLPPPSSPAWLLREWPPNMIQTDALFSYKKEHLATLSFLRCTGLPCTGLPCTCFH